MTHPLDHDGDGRPGGSLDRFDQMDVQALRALIKDRDGTQLPPRLGRDKLLAMARQTLPDQQPDEASMSSDVTPQPGSAAARAAAIHEREERLKREEREQREAAEAAQVEDGTVKVRILKRAAGQVAKGFSINNVEQFYQGGDTPRFPADVAKALEERGLVEIED